MSVQSEEVKKEKNRKASLKWKWKNIEKVRETQRKNAETKRRRDRDGYNRKQREYLAGSPEAKIRNLLCIARRRAIKGGMDFDVCIDDLVLPQKCPLLGIEINYAVNGRGARDDSPSIDRIDNSKGYVKGNVWVVSWRANRLKSNASLDELKRIYRSLEKKMDENC